MAKAHFAFGKVSEEESVDFRNVNFTCFYTV